MDKLLFCFSSLFCIHYWHILTCLWMMCQWYCYYITIMLTSHSIIPLPEYACKSYTFTNTWTIFHSVYVLNSKGHTALVACSTLSLSCSYHTKWKKALNGDTDSAGKTAPLIIETMTVQDRYQQNVVQDQVHPSSIQLPSTLFTSSPRMLCRSAHSLNADRTHILAPIEKLLLNPTFEQCKQGLQVTTPLFKKVVKDLLPSFHTK